VTADKLTATQRRWIESATPRVEVLARQLARRLRQPVDELRSAGYEGLVQAAQRYDPAEGTPFVAFAQTRIRGAMIDAVRRLRPEVRRQARALRSYEASQAVLEDAARSQPRRVDADPRTLQERVAAAADLVAKTTAAVVLARLPPDDPDAVPTTGEDAETQLLRGESARTVREELAASPPEDRELLEALYLQGQSMGEYAQQIGKNKSTISRQHIRALGRLAARLRRRFGET
jgi:RNA polymerase sigma factor for flagellar operon FliA